MQRKLNSYKTYKDKGLLVVIGMIIAYCLMLLPLCRGKGKGMVEVDELETFDDSERCPVELFEKYDWGCVNHLDEWYPGELNSSGDAQEMPVLTSTESHQRFKELCEKYNLPASLIWETENYYGLKEGTILCIAITETSGGKKGTYGEPGCWNYGNVGNNDRGHRRCFANQGAGLAAIGQTLNNSNLGNNKTIACLHGAGNCIEPDATGSRYATSESGNWGRNMVGCFYSIYGELIDQTTFNLHERK